MPKILVWRRNINGNKSYNGFIYPEKGEIVEANDWDNKKSCGGGLHGYDKNNYTYFDDSNKGNFVVIEVDTADGYIELGDKVKFKKGKVLYNGVKFHKMKELLPAEYVLHFDTQTSGNNSTQLAGHNSTQASGHNSTQSAGYSSTQTSESYSTQTSGYNSTQTARYNSTQTAGSYSTQTSGYNSTQLARHNSTQTSGSCSTQTARYNSTQTARYNSTQTAGYNSTQIASGDSTQTAESGSFINIFLCRNMVNVFSCGADCVVSVITDIKNYSYIIKKPTIGVISHEDGLIKEYKYTKDIIKVLDKWEIIIFGSNKDGNHDGGLAKKCKDGFNAEQGVSTGHTGQCFAINTMSGLDIFKEGLMDLKNNIIPGKIYLMTKIGCGIAGYSTNEVKKLIQEVNLPKCVILPKEFS